MTRRRPPPTDDEIAALGRRCEVAALMVGAKRLAEMDAQIAEATRGHAAGAPEYLAAVNAVLASWTEDERLAWVADASVPLRDPAARDALRANWHRP